MTKPLVKIYGERNTGTNYLSQLLRLNLEVEELPGVAPPSIQTLQRRLPGREWVRDLYFAFTSRRNLGWKHRTVGSNEKEERWRRSNPGLVFITITKNPYSWLLSLHRRPHHQYYGVKPDFETFLRTPWKTVGRDNLTGSGSLPNPIELWNRKNASYLDLKDAVPVFHLKFEDIVIDPASTITRIEQTFSLSRRAAAFTNYEPSTKGEERVSSEYRDYYQQEKWKEHLTPKTIGIINQSLDPQVMNYFGYQLLTG